MKGDIAMIEPTPATAAQAERRRILATDAALTRVHGKDAEASVVNALRASGLDERRADDLIASRVDSLDVAIDDVAALMDDPSVREPVRTAAAHRHRELVELRGLLDMVAMVAKMPDPRPLLAQTDGALTCELVHHPDGEGPDGAWDAIVLRRATGWPQDAIDTPARHMLRQYGSQQAPRMAFAASTTVTLWVLSAWFPALSVTAFVALMFLLLHFWCALIVATPLAIGNVSAATRARWAADVALSSGERRPDEVIYEFTGEELDVLHEFVPEHPLWTFAHPGVPDPDGTVEPVFQAIAAATVDSRHDAVTAWLDAASTVLGTYVDAPYERDTATAQELQAMRLIADELLQALRDHDAEHAITSEAIARAENTQRRLDSRSEAVARYVETRTEQQR